MSEIILMICNLDYENTITFLAFVISLTAVFFTWKGLKIQREHNYKSVKPIGRIRIADFESKIYAKIENSGIGPMILKGLTVYNGEKTNKSIIDAIPKELKERILWTNFTSNYEDRAIPVNGSLDLIVWTINSTYDDIPNQIEIDREELRLALKNLTVKIKYTDIYEENNFVEEQKFDWFGRNLEK